MVQNTIGIEDVAWQPDSSARDRSRLGNFLKFCGIDSYEALYRRSVEDVAWFTERVLDFLGIQFEKPYEKVLDLSNGLPWARWCVGGMMNISRSCLDRHFQSSGGSATAVIWEGEEGRSRSCTYSELFAMVEHCAGGLRALGIVRGDAVGLYTPMVPEAVAALLALARIGAIAVPLFSGYGPAAIEARLRDVDAKALFTSDAFPRRGVAIRSYAIAAEAIGHCPAISKLIVIPRMGIELQMCPGRDVGWEDLLRIGSADGAGRPEPTEPEDPLIVLYSSGTTGPPKGVLHSHCGFPVKAAHDMAFGMGVGPGDRIAWITDMGWMMGPWLIYGAAILGATVVLYDGAPDYPDYERIWEFCARTRTGILGLAPTFVRSMAIREGEPRLKHDLSSLKVLASTGEPWNPDPWWWLFEKVGGRKLPIINYSGGTEISGGILTGNPISPIKACAFSGPCLGISADVVDENGRPLRNGIGELVIRKPWIGMARGFWNDPERYLQTYWSCWPDVWRHGDWAQVDRDGHWYILGRSDDTLKISGKRIGPAEIESILVSHPAVGEAAVVGIPDAFKGNVAVAFCVPVVAGETAPDLCAELQDLVARKLGKPLRPEEVFLVSALPRTRNAKVMRRVIRNAYLDEELGNIAALENPETIGKPSTDELAVMIDTFRPLRVSRQALAIEDKTYYLSWQEGNP
jgi:acetyl-CoA synthetase